MVSDRIKVGLLPPILFSISIVSVMFSGVREVTGSPLFWPAFLSFGLVGAFLFLPDEPIPGKPGKRGRVGFLSLGIIILALVFVSSFYPDAIVLGLGAAGFPGGVGARTLYNLLFESRWSYCPKCEKTSWIFKRKGKWYCNLKGHVVEFHTPATAGLHGQLLFFLPP